MPDDFRFNNELFVDNDDRSSIEAYFPAVWFALYTPALTRRFDEVNVQSQREKARFRIFGYCAVALATFALSLAAFEAMIMIPAAEESSDIKSLLKPTALVAAASGLAGVLIGWGGMGIYQRKHAWLASRLLAERLRQWQWQYVLAHLPEIIDASGDPDAQQAYVEKRDREFDVFFTFYRGGLAARLNEHLEDSSELATKFWLDPELAKKADVVASSESIDAMVSDPKRAAALDELFQAYGRIRMQGQIDYVSYLLGQGPFASHPAKQKQILQTLSHTSVILIAFLHVAVVAGVLFDVSELKSPGVYICTIIFALVALALRVVEEGLRPTEELVRLRNYHNEIVGAQSRFHSGDIDIKLQSMRTLEEAGARELIDFLHSANTARYVM